MSANGYPIKVSILNKANHGSILHAVAQYTGEDQLSILNGQKFNSPNVDTAIWNNFYLPTIEDIDLYKKLPQFLKSNTEKKDIKANLRTLFWQNIEHIEQRPDSQFARLIELKLPNECSLDKKIELLETFIQPLIKSGMIVDATIHNPNQAMLSKITELGVKDNVSINSNIESKAFLLCSLRDYENGMFTTKNREWNSKSKLIEWKNHWDYLINNNALNMEVDKPKRPKL